MSVLLARKLRFIVPIALALALPAASAWAWCDSEGCLISGQTRYLWARTWNAQNSVVMPVSPYFIPRTPAACKTAGYPCGGACQNGELGEPNHYGAYPYPQAAAIGFDPMQFERLGRVPNEMTMGNAMAASPAAPAPIPPAK